MGDPASILLRTVARPIPPRNLPDMSSRAAAKVNSTVPQVETRVGRTKRLHY